MRWTGKNTATHIIALFAVFAALTGFSLSGTGSLSTAISSPEGEGGPSELAYHFPDQTGEPAILDKIDDSDYSIFRFAHHRFIDIFRYAGSGSASSFSRLQSHSTENTFDNKNTILIKLRI
jgi:hypothetical protein